MSKTKKINIWSDLDRQSSDGRRQRSDRSRRKIIQAMFELMREGDMTPMAVDVAARADVGLRTVFRHFEDMDSIFEEMTEEATSIIQPRIVAPFESTHWRDRLLELAERNAETFELIYPMQVALLLRRFQSDFLQRQYQREVHLIRSSIRAILPKNIAKGQNAVRSARSEFEFCSLAPPAGRSKPLRQRGERYALPNYKCAHRRC